MRTLLFFCIFFVAVSSGAVGAADQKEPLQFYPPFDLVEIAERVQRRQAELGVAEFRASVSVQFGTRTEWTNACSWLKEQTEQVLAFYVPPQNGNDEYYYYCVVSESYAEASVDALSSIDQLVRDFARQFSGAVKLWSIRFRDDASSENDAE